VNKLRLKILHSLKPCRPLLIRYIGFFGSSHNVGDASDTGELARVIRDSKSDGERDGTELDNLDCNSQLQLCDVASVPNYFKRA
jgi:hypothetical protein